MNEYQIAFWSSVAIFSIIMVLYVFCWIGHWFWAWIDDSKAPSENAFAKIIKKITLPLTPWKYPVFNGRKEEGMKPFGYAKKKEHENKCCLDMVQGADYVYDWDFGAGGFSLFTFACVMAAIPLMSILALKYFYVSIAVFSIVSVMFIARFARRHKKLFDKHIKDKDAHK